jgi:hypothetical protein
MTNADLGNSELLANDIKATGELRILANVNDKIKR